MAKKSDATEAEKAERARLRSELKGSPQSLSWEARDTFEDIEENYNDKGRKKTDG